ncbi:hypothetical protein BaRGS_00026259, partial [Batillaria attramentaria]
EAWCPAVRCSPMRSVRCCTMLVRGVLLFLAGVTMMDTGHAMSHRDTTDSWVMDTLELPMENTTGVPTIDYRLMAAIGNGHIATVLYNPVVYMNGLYNGPSSVSMSGHEYGASSADTTNITVVKVYDWWTHRAAIQSTQDITVSVQGAKVTRHYALDMWRAVFTETIRTEGLEIKHVTYAHQRLVQLLVTEIHVTRTDDGNEAFSLVIDRSEMNSTVDLVVTKPEDARDVDRCPDVCRHTYGHTLITETKFAEIGQVHVYWTEIPATLEMGSDQEEKTWIFVSSYDKMADKARSAFQTALDVMTSTPDLLLQTHEQAWADKWNSGRIDVEGDDDLDTIIHSSLYYILMSLPSTEPEMPLEQFYGLSPGSLARGANWTDYQGHVFWDMETWMYPPILVLFPDLARAMLSYRIYGGDGAAAKAHLNGYEGWQFPWESAFTGYEMTPDICIPCRDNQQHITGDVMFAARQYWSATHNEEWLQEEGGINLILQTAAFWASRAEYNQGDDRYEINGVMPPDEYAENINNSIYTNYVAKLNLNLGGYAACLAGLQLSETDRWAEVADKLYLVFNDTTQHHPEYEGYDNIDTAYNNNQVVKQADTVMLGYPLGMDMADEVRRNDLELYADRGDPNGPAMTWSMFTINWLDLANLEMAAENFNKSYSFYRRRPFNTWTEAKTGLGATNFITGMGGFLQAVIFGYAGMRIELEHLSFHPRLPPNTNKMKVTGLDYLGSTFDLLITDDKVLVIVREQSASFPLQLTTKAAGSTWQLKKGMELSLKREPFVITSLNVTECPMPEGSSCPDVATVETPGGVTASLSANIHTVRISQTGGEMCTDFIQCSYVVSRHMVEDNTINFFIGSDGRIYQGAPLADQAGVLRVAMLGDYTLHGMSVQQEAVLRRLVKCGMEQDPPNVHRDYKLQYTAQAPEDCGSAPCAGNALHCQLLTWKHWDKAQGGVAPDCTVTSKSTSPVATSASPSRATIQTENAQCPSAAPAQITCNCQSNASSDVVQTKLKIIMAFVSFLLVVIAVVVIEGQAPGDVNTWILESYTLPMLNSTGGTEIDYRLMASVANGHIATVVYSPTVYMNGLFNGPVAVFSETIRTEGLEIKHVTYAHQRLVQVLVTQIHVTRTDGGNKAFTLMIDRSEMNSTIDLAITDPEDTQDINRCPGVCRHTYGHTLITETKFAEIGQVHVYWTEIPATLEMGSDQEEKTWIFVSSYDKMADKARSAFQTALDVMTSTPDLLLQTHEQAWADKWNSGRIDAEGDDDLDTLIHSSLYYILSSLPSTQPELPLERFYGLAPGTLARGAQFEDYRGHVFWDQETWMMPPILMFFPSLARIMLSYRIYGGQGAAAKATGNGYKGWQFPWEAAFTGYEMTPSEICTPCLKNQQHVTGDIALGASQYWSVTRDEEWLRNEGGINLFLQTATFWSSRVEYNQGEDRYEINGIMPPDEFAENINNSIYTNYVAKLNLNLGGYAACLAGLQLSETDRWAEVADKLYLVFNDTTQHHPEYEGYDNIDTAYNHNQSIKIADAFLLGYPLGYNMPQNVHRNDMELYSQRVIFNGPAMTWSMVAINWLDLGEMDKAEENFHKSYSLYRRKPFNVWTEKQTGIGASNFITGMGGFLQAIMFGYAGLRVELEKLTFRPLLPLNITRLTFTGIKYLASTFDIVIMEQKILLAVRNTSPDFPLQLMTEKAGTTWVLVKGMELSFDREPFEISSLSITECPVRRCMRGDVRVTGQTMHGDVRVTGSSCPDVATVETPGGVTASLPANIHTFMISQTGGERCVDFIQCSQVVSRHMTASDDFNFYIGNDGRVYQGAIIASQAGILGVAMLGDYTLHGMSVQQEAVLRRLVKCGMEQDPPNVHRDYKLQYTAQAPEDCGSAPCAGNALHCQLLTWKHWDKGQTVAHPACTKTVGHTLQMGPTLRPTHHGQAPPAHRDVVNQCPSTPAAQVTCQCSSVVRDTAQINQSALPFMISVCIIVIIHM